MKTDVSHSRLLRCLGFFGAGATLALGSALVAQAERDLTQGPAPPPVIAAWAADRDAGVVYGLAADLTIELQVPLAWPTDVRPCGDGGAWVLRAGNGNPAGTYRLDRLARDGGLVAEVSLGACVDLDVADGRDALVIELGRGANGADRALRLETEGSLHVLYEAPGLECVAASRASVVVGTRTGRVVRIAEDGTVLGGAELGGEIGDLAAGPRPGSLWVLDVAGGARLLLLELDLQPRWSVATGVSALHVIPVPGKERAWLADTTEPIVRRFGPGGALELDRRGLPLTGLDRGTAWSDGSVLVAAPGA